MCIQRKSTRMGAREGNASINDSFVFVGARALKILGSFKTFEAMWRRAEKKGENAANVHALNCSKIHACLMIVLYLHLLVPRRSDPVLSAPFWGELGMPLERVICSIGANKKNP